MWDSKVVISRKEHRCEFCGDIIPKDTKCDHNKGLWEGEWQNYYLCIRCKDFIGAHKEVREEMSYSGFEPYEEYWIWLDYFGKDKDEKE